MSSDTSLMRLDNTSKGGLRRGCEGCRDQEDWEGQCGEEEGLVEFRPFSFRTVGILIGYQEPT